MTPLTPLTRPPARVGFGGTSPLEGLQGARFTIGRDAVIEATPEIMRSAPGLLAVDVETAGKDSARERTDLKAVIIGTSEQSWIFDPRDPYQYEMVHRVINEGQYLLAFHNSPFDVPGLYATGLMEVSSIERVKDTLIYARGAEPDERTSKDLKNASNRYLGLDLVDPMPAILKSLGISKKVWYATKDLDVPAYRIMAASDAILTHRLMPAVVKAYFNRLTTGHPFSSYGLKGNEALELVEREQIINREHLRRTCKGFLVDPEYLDSYREATAVRMREIEGMLTSHGIRPTVAADLTSYLEDQGSLPARYPRTPKTGRPSGAKGHLATLNHPIAQEFVEHKEVTHILRDYMDKVMDNADPTGRIHPTTNLLAAATGRMSISGDAPLHQFSAAARGIILADDFVAARANRKHPVLTPEGDPHPCTCTNPRGMVSIDWSQIEPVITANVAGDRHAVEYYEQGHKFYDALVTFGGISYKSAKVALLAQLYGEGKAKLAADLRVSEDDAQRVIDLIWKVLPGTRRLVDKSYRGGKLQTIAEQYRLIFTLSGRIVPIPSGRWPCWTEHETQEDIDHCPKCDRNGTVFSVAAHKGVNYFVQGSAYDLLAEAEVQIIKSGLGEAIYLAMHDELVVDQQAAHDIRKIMETPPTRLIQLAKRVPVLRTDAAHLGERWAAA